MTSTTVSNYNAAAAELPDEMFLGQLVCFTISEADVSLENARVQLEARNLSTETLRKRLRPIDAFKKATNEIAHKWTRMGDEQHSILVRQVGADSDSSHRHVVWERAVFKAGQRRRLEYQPLATLVYDRGVRKGDAVEDDSITVNSNRPIGLAVPPFIDEWLDEHMGLGDTLGTTPGHVLQNRFEHWCYHLDSHAVRTFVREYLAARGAVSVKENGGFYFVHQKHAAELRDLQDFVRSIGSQMYLIELLDIVEQRDMIAESFIEDALREVRALQVEIGKILSDPDRTITEATHDEYVGKAVALIAKADEYQQLLDRDLDKASTELLIFKTTVLGNEFSNKVKKPKSMSRNTP